MYLELQPQAKCSILAQRLESRRSGIKVLLTAVIATGGYALSRLCRKQMRVFPFWMNRAVSHFSIT